MLGDIIVVAQKTPKFQKTAKILTKNASKFNQNEGSFLNCKQLLRLIIFTILTYIL